MYCVRTWAISNRPLGRWRGCKRRRNESEHKFTMAPTSNGQPLFMLALLCRRTTPGAARQSIQDEAAQAGTVRVHVGGLFGQYLTAYVCLSCVAEHHQISSLLPCKCALSKIQPSPRPLQKPLTAVLPFKVRLMPVGPASLARELRHDVSGVVWRFL